MFSIAISIAYVTHSLAVSIPAASTYPEVTLAQLDPRELIGTAEDEAVADFPGEQFHNFYSRPDIKAPRFHVAYYDRAALAPGYWFVSPYHSLDQESNAKSWVGPYIYDNDGEVVWSGGQLFQHYNTFDFKMAEYDNEPMLTLKYPHGGAGVIFDSSYQIRQQVLFNKGGNYGLDMHEFNIVDNATRVLVVMATERKSSVDQAKEVGIKGNHTCNANWKGFEELDIETSDPVFTWDARDHLSLTESTYMPDSYENMCTDGWDILHLNAVDKFDDGDYLLSSRHADTLYKISHIDGSVVWRLGGKYSDWKFVTPDVKFSRQHHATFRGQNETHTLVAMFDNAIGTGTANEKATHENSRGLLLSLDHATKTASIAAEYDHPRGGMTNSRGSFQTLPNGNAFMGWTYHTLLSEHAPDGRLLMSAQLKLPGHCYRNYKFPWVGKPTQPPDVYAEASYINGTVHTVAYVSWNGATEVKYWKIHRSDASGAVTEPMASAPRSGFETGLMFDGFASHVVAEALDADGNTLGRSLPMKTIPPRGRFDSALMANLKWLQSHVNVPISKAIAVLPQEPVAAFVTGVILTIAVGLATWAMRALTRCYFGRRRQNRVQNTSSDTDPLLSDEQQGDYADVEKSQTVRIDDS